MCLYVYLYETVSLLKRSTNKINFGRNKTTHFSSTNAKTMQLCVPFPLYMLDYGTQAVLFSDIDIATDSCFFLCTSPQHTCNLYFYSSHSFPAPQRIFVYHSPLSLEGGDQIILVFTFLTSSAAGLVMQLAPGKGLLSE